jgi:hypothetical protein
MSSASVDSWISSITWISTDGSSSKVPVCPGQHPVDRLLRHQREVVVDRGEVDLALAQVDLADPARSS